MKRILYTLLLLLATAVPLAQGAEDSWTPKAYTDRTGAPIDLAQTLQAGRHVVFVFWQSWCGSCKKEAPALVEASRQFAKQAQFVGVISGSDDDIDEKKVDRFIADTALPYPQIRDKDLSLTRDLGIIGTPTIIVIAPNGRVVYRGHHVPSRWLDVFSS